MTLQLVPKTDSQPANAAVERAPSHQELFQAGDDKSFDAGARIQEIVNGQYAEKRRVAKAKAFFAALNLKFG